MQAVAHADQQRQFDRFGGRLIAHVDVGDVGMGRADGGRHLRQHALDVFQQQHDAGLEQMGGLLGPIDTHPAFAVAFEKALADAAFGGVHAQPLAAAEVADDRIARNRPAARRQQHRGAFAAVDQHQALRRRVVVSAETAHRQSQRVGSRAALCHQAGQSFGDDGGDLAAHADLGQQLGPRAVAAPARQLLPQRRIGRVALGQAQTFGPHRLRQHLFSELLRFLLLHALEVVADARTRPAGAHEVQPAGVGARARGADHLDHIAAAQLGAQRHRLAVDLGRDAVVAHIGVDRVGEVDRRGTARQRQDLRLRREHIDRVGKQIDLDVL